MRMYDFKLRFLYGKTIDSFWRLKIKVFEFHFEHVTRLGVVGGRLRGKDEHLPSAPSQSSHMKNINFQFRQQHFESI